MSKEIIFGIIIAIIIAKIFYEIGSIKQFHKDMFMISDIVKDMEKEIKNNKEK